MTAQPSKRRYVRTGVALSTVVEQLHAILRTAQLQTGAGLTYHEQQAAYAGAFGPLAQRRLYSALRELVQAGLVVPISGRPAQIAYGCADLPRPASPDPDADRLVAAVARLVHASGVAASTADVTQAVHADGGPAISTQRIRKLLPALCHPNHSVPEATWLTVARLERVEAASLTCEPTICWRLAGTDAPPPTLGSDAEAVRQLVRLAETAMGRPVSRSELTWYMEHVLAHGTSDERALCAKVPTPKLVMHLDATVRPRLRVRGSKGRPTVRRFDALALQYGVHRKRYAFAMPDDPRSPIMDVEHAVDVLRLAQEWESLRHLSDRATRAAGDAGGALLIALLDARCAVLRRLMSTALPYDDDTILTSAAFARGSATAMLAWLASEPVRLGAEGFANVSARLATPRTRLADLAALTALLSWPRYMATPREDDTPRALAEASVLTHDTACTLVEHIAVPVNPTIPAQRLTYIAAARRLANGRRTWGGAQHVLDRVDAVVLASRADDQPRAHALIATAHAMLGHVMRDSIHLETLLRRHPHADSGDRRALVVASALLGYVIPCEIAVPDPRDRLDTRAYLLACALGAPEQAVSLIDAADRRAVDAAREGTDVALGRAESGLLLAVIG
jgi:hypothetical protein